MSASSPPPVRIVSRGGGHALLAGRAFAANETILEAGGVVRDQPARHSLQIGRDAHLDAPRDAAPGDHPWRFLNHACRPNAAFLHRRLIALRPIAADEEITFDYETTEWDLVSPFACACGDASCEGREIRGFRHLTGEQRRRRWSQLREELRRLVDGTPVEVPASLPGSPESRP